MSACAKIKRKSCPLPVRAKSCPPHPIKRTVRPAGVSQIVHLLNTINNQLIGINNSLNTDLNQLSSVISSSNGNLNANLVTSVSALGANLQNTITQDTNTLISNMNTVKVSSCTVKRIENDERFTVPCGLEATIFENLSTADIHKVFITAASDQPWNAHCQAVLIVVDSHGHTIERALPPQTPPGFVPEEIHIVVDRVERIAIRCERHMPPPDDGPLGGFCTGFVHITEFVCICC